MKKTILTVAIVAVISGQASAVLFTDSFDSYANQAAFQAAWPIGTGVSGTLSTSPTPVSAPNSIAFGTAVSRNDRNVGELGNPSPTNAVRFSFDFYDTNGAASPYRQGATIVDSAAAGSSGGLITLGMNNHMSTLHDGGNFYMARLLGYTPTFEPPVSGPANPATGSGVFFKLNDNPALTRTTGWHNLAVEISFAAAGQLNYMFYVDNQLAETKQNVPITFRSFDTIRLGLGLTSTFGASIDNVDLENFDPTVAVPEAGSFAAVGLVGLLSVSAVWIRKRIARPPVEA